MNVPKAQLVCFSRKKSKMTLEMFGNKIEEANGLRLLGVQFDKDLRLTEHCRTKAVKAMQRIRLLRLISGRDWGANKRTLLQLYKQYIRPVLETGSVLTARTHKTNLLCLQQVQNAALRVALRAPSRTKIEDLHRQAEIQMIPDRLNELRRKAIARFGDSEAVHALEFQRLLQTGH